MVGSALWSEQEGHGVRGRGRCVGRVRAGGRPPGGRLRPASPWTPSHSPPLPPPSASTAWHHLAPRRLQAGAASGQIWTTNLTGACLPYAVPYQTPLPAQVPFESRVTKKSTSVSSIAIIRALETNSKTGQILDTTMYFIPFKGSFTNTHVYITYYIHI